MYGRQLIHLKSVLLNRFNLVGIRFKSIDHWAKLRKQNLPTDIALQHFDNFYGKVYGKGWKSARLGLLCPNKYCAVVNVFGDNEQAEERLKQLGAIELSTYYNRHWKWQERYKLRMKILRDKKERRAAVLAEERGVSVSEIDPETVEVSDVSDGDMSGKGGISGSAAEDFVELFETEQENREKDRFINAASVNVNLNDFVPITEMRFQEEVINDVPYYNFYQAEVDVPVEFQEEMKLEFPEILKVFTFPRGNLSDFPYPTTSKGLKLLDYYLMDGASLLPVLALGIQPKDIVGDFCAAPGGKALTMLLTLRPSSLTCNDKSVSRFARLKQVFKSYVPQLKGLEGMIRFEQQDAKSINAPETYDKILLDVPCTNDRISANIEDNNMFKPSRLKERINLPQDQCAMLVNALKCLKSGGSLVYSTCSLSPIQNDGVVHMALKQLHEETNIDFVICDLKEAFRPLRGLYKIHRHFKYGQQIVPFLPSNFGPLYVCKLRRK